MVTNESNYIEQEESDIVIEAKLYTENTADEYVKYFSPENKEIPPHIVQNEVNLNKLVKSLSLTYFIKII